MEVQGRGQSPRRQSVLDEGEAPARVLSIEHEPVRGAVGRSHDLAVVRPSTRALRVLSVSVVIALFPFGLR